MLGMLVGFQVEMISLCEFGEWWICLIILESWLMFFLFGVGQECYCMLYIGLRLLDLLVYLFQIEMLFFWSQWMLELFCRNQSSLYVIDLKCMCLVVISGKFFDRLKWICLLKMFVVLVLVWFDLCVFVFSMLWSRFLYGVGMVVFMRVMIFFCFFFWVDFWYVVVVCYGLKYWFWWVMRFCMFELCFLCLFWGLLQFFLCL